MTDLHALIHRMADELDHYRMLLDYLRALPPRPTMTDSTPLSPTAEAVWDSFCQVVEDHGPPRLGLAAAFRAAADQVVPVQRKPSADSDYHLMNWTKSLDQYYQRQQTRAELLSIAAELDPTITTKTTDEH